MAPPSWAYQVENFDPPADEELICSICRAIFCDPVQCPCNHVFCRACITKWLQTNKNCPVCRKRATRSSIQDVVPLIKNMILKLILRCKNSENGCDEKFSLEACETHMRACLYQMVKCKNPSCPEHLLRKEIEDHERDKCLFRCFKCSTCSLNISKLTPRKHSCVKDLQKVIKEKNQVIKLQEERIQQLMAENKSLKDAERDSDTSSGSISTTDIMISVADMPTFTSDSSLTVSESEDNNDDNFREWFSFNTFDDSSSATRNTEQLEEESRGDGNDSPALNVSVNVDTSEQSTNLEQDLWGSIENPRCASTLFDSSEPFFNVVESALPEDDDSPTIRRPNKRRYTSQLLSSSDVDVSDDDLPALISSKKCWRLSPLITQSPPNNTTAEPNLLTNNQTSNSFMEAGPSFRSNPLVGASESSTSASRTRLTRSKLRAKFSKKNANDVSTAPATDNLNSTNRRPIFRRTMKLLERYNLDSDPEWTPKFSSHGGNDTTSDSDESVAMPPFLESSDDSSWSNDYLEESGETSEESAHTDDYTSRLFSQNMESSDDDDEEWRPS
ncbi:uncharacterized protein LOC129230097 isoform X2 [Uloborus diversus]|uniref:uncharacterized protein LOC129230097 isoform X2 n=1 Tax=Uloborus diversus TaxID=327109 RepID=UPI002409EA52|nr:uncharacterized protein LOC129230097 isoform X2 [Uloborus diversus]